MFSYFGIFIFALVKMADEIKKEVVKRLQLVNLDQLKEICTRMSLNIPAGKETKGSTVLNVVMRHISSEEVEDESDGGSEILSKINDELKVMLGEDGEDKTKVQKEIDDQIINSSKTRVEVHKFRQFKITGLIGGTENAIDYRSLCYQIQEGRSEYTTKQIVSGVIRAMKSGSSLRKYFEGRPNVTEEMVMKMLRSYYNVKDSTLLLDEMMNTSQEPKETEMNFLLRMMGLRDNIMTLTKEEQFPLGDELVRRKFFHAVSVGLKQDTIRLELRQVLKEGTMEDEELLKELSEVVARDNENRKKTKGGKNAVSNMLNADTEVDGKTRDHDKGRDGAVLAEIKQLYTKMNELTTRFDDVSTMKDEIKDLKKQMNRGNNNNGVADNVGFGGGYKSNNGGRRGFVKCKSCEEKKVFCTHCSVCGDGNHKRRECPKNV